MNRTISRRASCLGLCVISGSATAFAQTAQFVPLGFPGGSVSTVAVAISGDGLTVAGYGTIMPNLIRVWWWRAGEATMLTVSVNPNRNLSMPADGSQIVGTRSVQYNDSYRYYPATGQYPAFPSGVQFPMFESVSSNGLVYGGSIHLVANNEYRVGRWSQASGYQELFQVPVNQGSITALSSDGSVQVGYLYEYFFGNGQAFAWSAAGGAVSLGYLASSASGALDSAATDVTENGDTVVGWTRTDTGNAAFRWTASHGMVDLGAVHGPETTANGISANGSVIVGASPAGAFIWTPTAGVKNLKNLLLTQGASGELAGWTLTSARAVSHDGKSIVGVGVDPNGKSQAFLAVTGACYANCDQSTGSPVLNSLDFGCFLNKFSVGDPYANCDDSLTPPMFNALDFLCFLTKFAEGC